MKSVLPPVAVLALVVLGAARTQAYGPGSRVQLCCAGKADNTVVQGPSRCAATPTTRCFGSGWVCLRRDDFQKCYARWTCAADIKNPQTREPFQKPKPLPWSRRTPPSPITR